MILPTPLLMSVAGEAKTVWDLLSDPILYASIGGGLSFAGNRLYRIYMYGRKKEDIDQQSINNSLWEQNAKLRDDFIGLMKEHGDLKATLRGVEKDCEGQTKTIDAQARTIESMRSEIGELRKERTALHAAALEDKRSLQEARERIIQLESQIKLLQEQVKEKSQQ